MYHIPYFKAKDEKEILQFMQEHPFVVLCGVDKNSKPVATHVPVLIEQREDGLFLKGHIMRKTDHHLAFAFNENVLGIFTGPNTYVSASWYTNPRQGSTWNYITVHAKGTLKFLDEDGLMDVLQKLTAHFENDSNSPSLFEKLAEDYVRSSAKAIIAFEIEVHSIENVFKLSQNRDEKSFENIVTRLEERDENAKQIAEEMQKRKDQFFSR